MHGDGEKSMATISTTRHRHGYAGLNKGTDLRQTPAQITGIVGADVAKSGSQGGAAMEERQLIHVGTARPRGPDSGPRIQPAVQWSTIAGMTGQAASNRTRDEQVLL